MAQIRGITIKLDADASGIDSALKGVNSTLKQTQSDLRDINKLLKLDPKNTELLEQKQKNLKGAIEQTNTKLEKLKEAQKGVAEGSREWDALQREIIDTENQLQSLEGELRNFGSVGAQQIVAAGQSMQDFGNKVTAAGEALKPVSAAAAALVGAMAGLGFSSASAADDLVTLAQQAGVSTDFLQMLDYAASRIDVDMNTVTGALGKMTKGMAGNPEAFEALGVAVTDADGHMRDAESVFMDTIEALSGIENPVERDQAAMEIFGKSANELAGLIDDGGQAFREYGQEAEDLHLILSGEVLNDLVETNNQIDKSKAQLKAAGLQLGATIMTGLAPALEKVAGAVEALVGWLQTLTPAQTNLIMGIAGVIAVIAPLLIIGGKLITGIGMLMVFAPILVGAFGGVIATVGIVIGVITALVAVGVLLYKNWDKIVAWAKATWSAIVSTIKGCIDNIKTAFSEFGSAAKQSMTETWENIKTTITNAVQTITEKVQGWIDAVKAKVSEFANIGRDVVNKIKEGITQAWDGLVGWFKDIWDKLFGNLKVGVTVTGESDGQPGYGAMTGLDFVPFNGFPAVLHRGEAVLTAGEAQRWRGGETSIDYDRLASAIASRPIEIVGDTNRIFKVVRQTNTTRTRATNYNALAMG